jgi:hypothetical protein
MNQKLIDDLKRQAKEMSSFLPGMMQSVTRVMEDACSGMDENEKRELAKQMKDNNLPGKLQDIADKIKDIHARTGK